MRADATVDVSIIVVSYNTLDLTRAAIESVVAQARAVTYELIVIDNASHDGSPEMLAQHEARPNLIALKDNIGFARANNLGARAARGRYLLLLNPDTVVLDGAIDRLVAFARDNPEARIWGGRTLFADGRLNPSSCWGRMTPWNQLCRATGLTAIFPRTSLFNGEAIGGWQRDSARRVDIVSGCFLLTDMDLWRQLDGFDPAFFMYGEEADYCLRARAAGARPMITPSATIVHYGGASEKTRADKMVRLLNAKATLIRRHWHPYLRSLGLRLLKAWPLSRAIATTIRARMTAKSSHEEAAAAWRAIWSRRTEWHKGYPQRQTTSGPTCAGVAVGREREAT